MVTKEQAFADWCLAMHIKPTAEATPAPIVQSIITAKPALTKTKPAKHKKGKNHGN